MKCFYLITSKCFCSKLVLVVLMSFSIIHASELTQDEDTVKLGFSDVYRIIEGNETVQTLGDFLEIVDELEGLHSVPGMVYEEDKSEDLNNDDIENNKKTVFLRFGKRVAEVLKFEVWDDNNYVFFLFDGKDSSPFVSIMKPGPDKSTPVKVSMDSDSGVDYNMVIEDGDIHLIYFRDTSFFEVVVIDPESGAVRLADPDEWISRLSTHINSLKKSR